MDPSSRATPTPTPRATSGTTSGTTQKTTDQENSSKFSCFKVAVQDGARGFISAGRGKGQACLIKGKALSMRAVRNIFSFITSCLNKFRSSKAQPTSSEANTTAQKQGSEKNKHSRPEFLSEIEKKSGELKSNPKAQTVEEAFKTELELSVLKRRDKVSNNAKADEALTLPVLQKNDTESADTSEVTSGEPSITTEKSEPEALDKYGIKKGNTEQLVDKFAIKNSSK